MRLRMNRKSAMKAIAMSTLILLSACADPIPEACAWLKPVQPDPGFQDRWTRDEKNQVDTLDKNIDQNCGRTL